MNALTIHIDYEVVESHTDPGWPGLRILDKIRVRGRSAPHDCPDPESCTWNVEPVEPYEWQYARGGEAAVET